MAWRSRSPILESPAPVGQICLLLLDPEPAASLLEEVQMALGTGRAAYWEGACCPCGVKKERQGSKGAFC